MGVTNAPFFNYSVKEKFDFVFPYMTGITADELQ